jgi:hypothetical protein
MWQQTPLENAKYFCEPAGLHISFSIYNADAVTASNTVHSESHCALRLWTVDLVVSITLTLKCAVVSVYSVVKQQLKCNIGKAFNCLIQSNSDSDLYRCSWTSLPTPFVSAQQLSEHTV